MRAVDQSGHLLLLALELAAGASALMLERLDQPRSDIRTKSTQTDMVTEVDRAAEALIVEGIRSARPDDAILSEEGGGGQGTSAYRWIVDPLDGTTNYLYGLPGFGVSIAVERDGEAVVGVVQDPLRGEVFAARRGGGATRNGRSIQVSGETRLGCALVATGFGYGPERRVAQAQVLARVIGQIRDIRRMGAAAVDLCSVACGRVDAYFERGLNHWDLAAGGLIAAEAGARLGAIGGGPPAPGSVIAAAPALFEALQQLLITAGAAEHV